MPVGTLSSALPIAIVNSCTHESSTLSGGKTVRFVTRWDVKHGRASAGFSPNENASSQYGSVARPAPDITATCDRRHFALPCLTGS